MKAITRRALVASGTTALAIGSALVPASAAQAVPRQCSGAYELHQYRVYCSGGTGEFRAAVKCYRIGSSSYVWRYGPWRRTGSTDSAAVCRSSEEPTGGYAQLRG
jgi:hypothetical protein